MIMKQLCSFCWHFSFSCLFSPTMASSNVWSCSVCTFNNQTACNKCEMCGSINPSANGDDNDGWKCVLWYADLCANWDHQMKKKITQHTQSTFINQPNLRAWYSFHLQSLSLQQYDWIKSVVFVEDHHRYTTTYQENKFVHHAHPSTMQMLIAAQYALIYSKSLHFSQHIMFEGMWPSIRSQDRPKRQRRKPDTETNQIAPTTNEQQS